MFCLCFVLFKYMVESGWHLLGNVAGEWGTPFCPPLWVGSRVGGCGDVWARLGRLGVCLGAVPALWGVPWGVSVGGAQARLVRNLIKKRTFGGAPRPNKNGTGGNVERENEKATYPFWVHWGSYLNQGLLTCPLSIRTPNLSSPFSPTWKRPA